MRSIDELTLYAYGLLDEAEQGAVVQHLDSCPDCLEMVRRIGSERRLLKDALPRMTSGSREREDVTQNVLDRRPVPERARAPSSPEVKPGAKRIPFFGALAGGVAASLAIILFAGLFVSPERGGLANKSSGSRAGPVESALTTPPRSILAYVQPAALGTMAARDEEGRPVDDLGLASHQVSVEILDGFAKTTIEEKFRNPTDRRLEGTFQFPLPADASISRLALEVNGHIEEGTCLERERAREVFESIVRKMKDPALLEWMAGGLFKCRVFPIEPRSTKRVIIAYTQSLPFFRGKVSYTYPLASEKTRTHPPEELRIEVQARCSTPIRNAQSPSHPVDVRWQNANEVTLSYRAVSARPKSDFVLSFETDDPELRVIPYKADGEDGYFALLLTPQGALVRLPRRYVFVLDVSASVTGAELEVEKTLVRAMMENRIAGDRFEILGANVEVSRSGEVDLRAANDFMDRLNPMGASDLLSGLQAAPEGDLIYIGKGIPTYGERDGGKILEALKGRSIRTIGVGSRANAGLLQKLGGYFRVSPGEDVPNRAREIARTLGSPALSDIQVDGGKAVYDVVGIRDVFYGERLVLAGRYRGPAATVVVSGRGYRRESQVSLPMKEEGNNYVRRLWAERKVQELLAASQVKKKEITELGVKYQIMTPFTSFLVLENEEMWKAYQLKREVQAMDQVLGTRAQPRSMFGQSAMVPVPEVQDPTRKKPAQVGREGPFSGMQAPEPSVAQLGPNTELSRQDPNRKNLELTAPVEGKSSSLTTQPSVRTPGSSIDNPSGQVGPGFSSQETARLESWDLRAQTFRTLGRGEGDDFLKGRSTSLPMEVESPMRNPTPPNQSGGLEFSLSPSPGVAGPGFSNGSRESTVPPPPGPTGFVLPTSGAVPNNELTRPPDPVLQMETRVTPLRFLNPVPIYSAKVEPKQFINGQPDVPSSEIEAMLSRSRLYQLIRNQLTKNASGQILGKVEFDPQSHVFVVRDTPAVLERVSKIIEAFDVEPDQVLFDLRFIRTTNEDLVKSVPAMELGQGGSSRPTPSDGGLRNPGLSPEETSRFLRSLKEDRLSHFIQEPTLGLADDAEGSIAVSDPERGWLHLRPRITQEAGKVTLGYLLELGGAPGHDSGTHAPLTEVTLPVGQTIVLRNVVAAGASPDRKEHLLIFITPRIVPRTERANDSLKRMLKLREELEIQELDERLGKSIHVVSASAATGEIALDRGSSKAVIPGQLFAIWRNEKVVALVSVRSSIPDRATGVVWQGLALGPVLPGDLAREVKDLRAFWSDLPESSRLEWEGVLKASAIREKMRLPE